MACNKIGHGAQTAEGAEAAGLAFDGLEDAVEGFGGGVGAGVPRPTGRGRKPRRSTPTGRPRSNP